MIHIASAFDKNYFNPFCALLSSIMETQERGGIHMHVIAEDIVKEEKEKIILFVNSFQNEITFHTYSDDTIDKLIVMSTWTKAVYYRLYFPIFLQNQTNRFLYVDADTIVLNDVSDFYHMDLEDKPIAAVWDNYVKTQPLIGITEEGEYFNSGVLLIDISAWTQQNISEKTIQYLLENPEKIKYVDQCALNAILKNNWLKLDKKYNLLYSYIPQDATIQTYQAIKKETSVIHFTLQRPWNLLCKNRFRNLYKYYFKRSPAKENKMITDFSFNKLRMLVQLRLIEFYQDHLILKKIWRQLKFKNG